jgi:hypothetical protein
VSQIFCGRVITVVPFAFDRLTDRLTHFTRSSGSLMFHCFAEG